MQKINVALRFLANLSEEQKKTYFLWISGEGLHFSGDEQKTINFLEERLKIMYRKLGMKIEIRIQKEDE